MQLSYFNAYCPFEIGDKVRFKQDEDVKTYDMKSVYIVDEIVTEHYLKSGSVVFKLALKDSDDNKYAPINIDYFDLVKGDN
ncbi:MAG: hypothetical protein ACRDA5_02365 [Clostridium sp.]